MSDNTNDRTIDEATPDTNISGTELIPVSDSGAAKSATTAQIRDFVINYILGVSAGSSYDYSRIISEGVYVKNGNALSREPVEYVVKAVSDYLQGQSAVSTTSGNETFVVQVSGENKTISLSAISSYVLSQATQIGMNIHALTAATNPIDDADETAIAQEVSSGVWSTLKATMSTIASYINGKLRSAATESSATIHNDDEIITFEHTNHTLRRTPFSSIGIGKGNVIGPNANTDENIPQWYGADSKTLKNGLGVIKSNSGYDPISSASTDTTVPTAAAVYQHVSTVQAAVGDVKGPNSSTDSHLAQFDGVTGKKIKGGIAISTSPGAAPSNSNVLTEKAVVDYFVKSTAYNDDGRVPMWGAEGSKSLLNGYEVDTQYNTPGALATYETVNAACESYKRVKTFATSTAMKAASHAAGTICFCENEPDRIYVFTANGLWRYAELTAET